MPIPRRAGGTNPQGPQSGNASGPSGEGRRGENRLGGNRRGIESEPENPFASYGEVSTSEPVNDGLIPTPDEDNTGVVESAVEDTSFAGPIDQEGTTENDSSFSDTADEDLDFGQFSFSSDSNSKSSSASSDGSEKSPANSSANSSVNKDKGKEDSSKTFQADNGIDVQPEEGGQSLDLDLNKKRLRPFASKRGERKEVLRSNQLDVRKNLKRNDKVVQTMTLGLLGLIVAFGAWNSVAPDDSLTPDEVATIVNQQVGKTKFPLESGRGFATDFMRAYLSMNSDSTAGQVLNYYYNGTMDSSVGNTGSSNSVGRSATGSYKQEIVYGPTVYSNRSLTDNSGSYTIGALVKSNQEKKDGANSTNVDNGLQWVFFNVNVYFDNNSQSFSIAPDSPTLIPNTEVEPQQNVPKSLPLVPNASDDKDLGKRIQSTVEGYINGFATATPTDHSSLDQYVSSSADTSVFKGLGGVYKLSDSGSAISYETYPVDSDATQLKVRVKVTWTYQPQTNDDDTDSNAAKVDYTSQYVMTLDKTNNRYEVSRFQPEYFAPDMSAVQSDSDSE